MTTEPKYPPSKVEHTPATHRSHNSDKSEGPGHRGGKAAGDAHKWGGGSKASKGPIPEADRKNEQSSAKS
jgi:hypothetical protein